MSSPCNNSPDEVIEKVVAAKADADKFNRFVNGTKYETVQLGYGPETPVIRNVVAQMQLAAGAAGTYESDLEVVNAKDFGAVDARNAGYTDNVLADNAIAIQAAISSAKANGGTVYIPNGVKYLRSGIDATGVLVVDDSTGFRVTSKDWWWRPGVPKGGMKLVAHRGLCAVYPENTVLAFSGAAQSGCFYGIETDICWTSDGYPVCIHDNSVDRTTDGTGDVASLTLAQIRALDAGSFLSPDYSECKVPTFEEYITICSNHGLAPFIEIKTASNVTESRLCELVDIVAGYGMLDSAVFLAFTWDYLGLIRKYSPLAGVCGLSGAAISEDNKKYLQWLGGRVFWGPSLYVFSLSDTASLINSGIAIYAWTGAEGNQLADARARGSQFFGINNAFI